MSDAHILLVEDEPNIACGLIYNLEAEGFQVTHVKTGEEALSVPTGDVALVILDLMLPGIDGFEVCRQLRAIDPRLPILMLTARGAEVDRVEGLKAGADDYLAKPFSLDEFLLRVEGMLRRSEWYRPADSAQTTYVFGGNTVHLHEQRAETAAGEIVLTELEVRMLDYFIRNEGRIVERKQLLKAVWGVSPDTETRTLDNFVVRLRRYFEADPATPIHFQTVRGRGYRFVRAGDK
ncbi:MAG: response regulator transcription factor [Desulfuromonadales bacterium]|nr:response regulator transcription factor [Desulfuromonadales bacterium]